MSCFVDVSPFIESLDRAGHGGGTVLACPAQLSSIKPDGLCLTQEEQKFVVAGNCARHGHLVTERFNKRDVAVH